MGDAHAPGLRSGQHRVYMLLRPARTSIHPQVEVGREIRRRGRHRFPHRKVPRRIPRRTAAVRRKLRPPGQRRR
ncbi:hypothetical protein GS506_06775 [Rhodococcus hoagii]|nr:hypothetical protein [Prescottella equi]